MDRIQLTTNRLVLLAFGLIVLLQACGTPETLVEPTNKEIQAPATDSFENIVIKTKPSAARITSNIGAATPISCAKRSLRSGVTSNLSPYKAITRNRLKYNVPMPEIFIGPKYTSDTVLIVYFSKDQSNTVISKDSLDWMLVDQNCTEHVAVGFGIPSRQYPAIIIGRLGAGAFSTSGVSRTDSPLIALIYIVPADIKQFKIVDGQGNEVILPVSNNWYPELKHLSSGELTSEAENTIFERPSSGLDWAQFDASAMLGPEVPAVVAEVPASCTREVPVTENPNKLTPVKVITRSKLTVDSFDRKESFSYPRNQGNEFLVVFFEIIGGEATELFRQDLDWRIIGSSCQQLIDIGFGFGSDYLPFRLTGEISGGSIFVKSEEPLIGLAYVVPIGTVDFSMFDPQGTVYRLSIDNSWHPSAEHGITGIGLNGIGSGISLPQGGESWKVGP